MQVSELVARTGVPLATVKYYLREGLLMPGHATSATRAVYDETHVRRLGLIKGLSGLGLSLNRIRAIIALIDEPGPSLFDALGRAVAVLPPSEEPSARTEDADPVVAPTPAAGTDQALDAAAVLRLLGWSGRAEWPAVQQLDHALAAAAAAGIPMDGERLASYAVHTRAIAEVDIDLIPQGSDAEVIEYAVLGTALYEPIIAALRRIAHSEFAARRFGTGQAGTEQADAVRADAVPDRNMPDRNMPDRNMPDRNMPDRKAR